MAQPIELTVNGEPRTIAAGSTVADLIRELGCRPEQVAVERNKEIVRRPDHARIALVAGDRLEVVTLFGGG